MKKYTILLLVIGVAWLFCQCKGDQETNESGNDYPSHETFDAIDSCMSFMNTNPQKAHQMLDSLREKKLMTQARCDYYHAMITFSGEEDWNEALTICNRLLDEGKFGDDRYLEEEICVLASNMTSGMKRYLETLKYAKRGIAICHGNENMRGDEATLMGRVGMAEQGLGHTEQARETYARAYELLGKNTSFSDLIAIFSLKKKETGLYKETKEYDKMIEICKEVLDMAERFDRDPSFIEQRPATMKESGEATHEFANLYRSQMYTMLARTYRMKVELGLSKNADADSDSVRWYLEKWSEVNGPQSSEALSYALPELYFTGRMAEFQEAKEKAANLLSGDTLVTEYLEYLTILAKEAADNHDLKTSNSYLKRALVVSDSIRRQETMRTLAEQMSLNMVQEQRLARQDAEHQMSAQKFIIALMATLLLVIIAGIIIVILLKKIKQKQELLLSAEEELTETKEEVKELVLKLEETRTEKTVLTQEDMYELIGQVMKEQQLYTNPEFDIKMLVCAVNSNRSVVSKCINDISGKGFRQWLAEYRLKMFMELLKSNPDLSLDALTLRCGYKDPSTFRRHFKNIYGVTPSEYRIKLSQDRKTED